MHVRMHIKPLRWKEVWHSLFWPHDAFLWTMSEQWLVLRQRTAAALRSNGEMWLRERAGGEKTLKIRQIVR